jgi:endonuclease/exonuclease/phosphatase family metal-dependent hydrolase
MTISVATYNVHRCIGRDAHFDPSRTLAVLRELDSDVIALQELQWRAEDAMHVLADFSAQLGYSPIAGPTLFRSDGHYGNAVLTRLDVREVERVDLSVPGREARGALDVTLATRDGPLRVIATHFGLSPGERREQMQRLLARLDRASGPLVLMGDMNEWFLWGRPLKWLRKHFGRTPAPPTFPARWPIFALDRVWVEPRGMVRDIAVHTSAIARAASDHLPVRATLEWRTT